MEKFILEQITSRGASVFWVAPRIEKGEEFDEDHEVKDAETLYDHLRRGAFSGIDVDWCMEGWIALKAVSYGKICIRGNQTPCIYIGD